MLQIVVFLLAALLIYQAVSILQAALLSESAHRDKGLMIGTIALAAAVAFAGFACWRVVQLGHQLSQATQPLP